MTELSTAERTRDRGPAGPTGSAARGSLANLAGAAVASAATFAGTIAVTRGLPRPAAGVFFTATSLFLLATSVGQLGTGSGLVYFFSRCRALGTPGLIPRYLRAALAPVVVSGIAMTTALFVFAPSIAAWLVPGHESGGSIDLRILAPFIPFVVVENVFLAASRGMATMRANVVVEQLCRPAVQLALILGAGVFASGAAYSWAWAFGFAPAAGAAWWWWRTLDRQRCDDVPEDRTAPHVSREFWRFTAPRSVASVAQQAMQRLDIVLVGALAGAVPAAVYAAATRFIVVGQMGRNAVSLAVQPQLAASLAHRDKVTTNWLYQVSTTWLMAVTWPLYLVLAVLGGPLLQIFGHGYQTGALVLVLLSASMLVATLCGDVDVMLIMAGRTSWSLVNVSVAFGTNLGLDLWLIPSHGVTGAAIGWATAIAVKNLSALVQIAIVMKLHPFGAMTTTVAALSVACFAAVPVAVRSIVGAGTPGLLVAVLIGGSAYLAGLWVFRGRLRLDEFRELRSRRRTGGPGSAV